MEDYIFEYHSDISLEVCNSIIKKFENDENKVRGEMLGGLDRDIKVTTDLFIANNGEKWGNTTSIILKQVVKCLDYYEKYLENNKLDINFSIKSYNDSCCITPPKIQKTDVNGFFDWHHDAETNRAYTYIFYLNDVEEDCGGTTEFLCGKCVQPRAGKILLFPASVSYIHRGKKLEKGVKYIMTGYICSGFPMIRS